MKRELGKVPTKVNKDMVAGGTTKNRQQIIIEGSKRTDLVLVRLQSERNVSKSIPHPDQIRAIVKKEVKMQLKDFTKRIIKERGKDR